MRRLPRLPGLALALCALVGPSAARADNAATVTTTIAHYGRLLDGNDQPVEGQISLTFSLYAVPEDPTPDTPTQPLWTETYAVIARGGIYQVQLGSTSDGHKPLPGTVFAAPSLWMGVKIANGGELRPRLRVGAVPQAVRADTARALACADCATGEAVVSAKPVAGGLVALDSNAKIPLAALPGGGPNGLNADQVGGFSAAPANAPVPGALVALDSTGKLPLSVLPGGTAGGLNADQVDGFHAAPASAPVPGALVALDSTGKLPLSVLPSGNAGGLNADLVDGFHAAPSTAPVANALVALDAAGKMPIAALPVGTGPGTVAAGDHTHPDLVTNSVKLGSLVLNEDLLKALLVPTISVPADNGFVSPTPTLRWNGLGTFTVEVALASQPSTPVWTTTTTQTSATVSPALNVGTNYVWRVKSTVAANTLSTPDAHFTVLPAVQLSGSVQADTVRTTMLGSAASGASTMSLASVAGLAVGDMLAVVDLQGVYAGQFEFRQVRALNPSLNTVDFTSPLASSYPAGDRVMVQKAIYGSSVTINPAATVTASAWDGSRGGVVAIYAEDEIVAGNGSVINADFIGYRGGTWRNNCSGVGGGTPDGVGESVRGGYASYQNTANQGGGGGAEDGCVYCTSAGGGGGYASGGAAGGTNSPGNNNCPAGQGGGTYGDTGRSTAFFGSGGGAGSNASNGSAGGNGGGIVLLFARNRIDTSLGTINARGAAAGSNYQGGGGAGGTVLAVAPRVVLGAANVAGGAGNSSSYAGGAGGTGRVKAIETLP